MSTILKKDGSFFSLKDYEDLVKYNSKIYNNGKPFLSIDYKKLMNFLDNYSNELYNRYDVNRCIKLFKKRLEQTKGVIWCDSGKEY